MKRTTHRIICGTDFSARAAQAATVAAKWAARLNDTLVLIHVFELAGSEFIFAGAVKELEAEGRARLAAEADRLRKLGARVEEKFLFGSADQALLEAARGEDVRLVLVGADGHSALESWLLGSVAERTAESAPVPTLVLRSTKALEGWVDGVEPLKVLLAADFSTNSDAAFTWAKQLQQVGPCKLTVAHVNWPPEELNRLGVSGPPLAAENSRMVQRVLERDLREKAERLIGAADIKVPIEPDWGVTSAQLMDMARRDQTDVIVIGTHQRHGLRRLLGSVSRSLLRRAPMNVAVVPTRKEQALAPRIPVVKRVLVTTDFSELANRAVPHAYSPLLFGGTVQLIHVIPPFEFPGPTMPHYRRKPVTRKEHAKRVRMAAEQLRALIPDEAAQRGIGTEIEVVQGRNPAEAICQAAERFGADLICMGSHGRSGMSQAVLGSVAQAVMAKSRKPLLVIRSPKE